MAYLMSELLTDEATARTVGGGSFAVAVEDGTDLPRLMWLVGSVSATVAELARMEGGAS